MKAKITKYLSYFLLPVSLGLIIYLKDNYYFWIAVLVSLILTGILFTNFYFALTEENAFLSYLLTGIASFVLIIILNVIYSNVILINFTCGFFACGIICLSDYLR